MPRLRWVPAGEGFGYTLPGAWVALAFVCLSFTPSLLPRPAFFQGFVCGVNGAIGYGIGVVGAWLWRQFADRPARPARPGRGRRSSLWALWFWSLRTCSELRWQLQIRDLMGVPAEGVFTQFLLPVVAALVFVGLVALARGIRGSFAGSRGCSAAGWVAGRRAVSAGCWSPG